jgi:hypothetical protein
MLPVKVPYSATFSISIPYPSLPGAVMAPLLVMPPAKTE